MKKILLDTNFLLIPGQFKIDIFTEMESLMKEPFELCILSGTMEELDKLATGKNKDAFAAKLGIVLAKQKGLKMLPSSSHVDDVLVEMSDKNTIIATQDKELKKRVNEKGALAITMRQKQRLVLEG